jgi:Fe-S-cluster containining protein
MKFVAAEPSADGRMIYRLYPVADPDRHRVYKDEKSVCGDCVSGACCSSEGPIAVSAFDILRLATHLDLAPEAFLKLFTQDAFDGCPFDPATIIDDAKNSTVTYLRRRGPEAFSPCIFLKYVSTPGEVPRRQCSVHDARPLACREYYFDTCKTRWTGELALSMADAYRQLEAGRISAATGRARLRALQIENRPKSMRQRWQGAIWTEVVRAACPEQANNEGTVFPSLPSMQRPVKVKLAHMLNKSYLRFEEKYGPVPHDEQLQPYSTASLDSGERARLLRIASRRAAPRLFNGQDYPYIAGARFLSPRPIGAAATKAAIVKGDESSVTDALGRGLSFIGVNAWQIVTRGPSTNPDVDRECRLALMNSLVLIDLDLIPKAARDSQLESTRHQLAGLLSRTLAQEVAWVARNKLQAKQVARWWRTWAKFESTDVPISLRRQIGVARRRLAVPGPPRKRARLAPKAVSDSVATRIVASQDESGSWGADVVPDGLTFSHFRYVDLVLRRTARQIQRLNLFIQAQTQTS